MSKRCMGAMGIAAALFAQQAQAGSLKLLGTQVELPFDYKVLSHTEGFDRRFDDYLQMADQQRDKDAKDGFTNVSMSIPALFASLQGQAATADGPLINGLRHSAVTRWGSRQNGTMFLSQVERLNGSPIETALARQLATAAPQCCSDLPFGAAAPTATGVATLAPPPAPPASAGGRS
jgi:hypothetical protein